MIVNIPVQALYEFSQSKIPCKIVRKYRFEDNFYMTTLDIPNKYKSNVEYVVKKLKEKYKRVRL